MTPPPPASGPTEPDSKARLRLWLQFLKASRAIEGELRANLRTKFNTTLPRFDVMAALYRHRDGLKMSELSGVLRVSNGNVTGIVDRLADEGIVERVAVEGDRRASLVQLTTQGEMEFKQQAAAHEAWIDGMLAEISPEEASDFGTSLGRMIKALDDEEA